MMNQLSYIHLFTVDPVTSIKTALRFLHFVGLALGLGAATLLDLMLLRFFVKERISREAYRIVSFSSNVVNIGLLMLWITGLSFLVHYAVFDPEKLTNEKIWAKMAIVYALSVNGLFIHVVILPRIRSQIGKPLFEGIGTFRRSAFIVSGAVSATSWYFPVFLGAFPQLNFAVPASTILASYCIVLTVVIAAMHAVLAMIDPTDRKHPQIAKSIVVQFGRTGEHPRLRGADQRDGSQAKRAA